MGRSTKGSSFRVAAKGVVAAQSLRRLWCLQKRWAFVTDADLQDSGEWVKITEATPKIRPFWSIEKIREDWLRSRAHVFSHSHTAGGTSENHWADWPGYAAVLDEGCLSLVCEMTETWCDDDMEISGKNTEKTYADPCPAYSKTFKHLQILFHKTYSAAKLSECLRPRTANGETELLACLGITRAVLLRWVPCVT